MSRSTFSFDESVERKLNDLANKKHTTKTEVLRRAIALYDLIESRRNQQSSGVTVEFEPGKKVELVMP
jgi:predicted transcriptional regulator